MTRGGKNRKKEREEVGFTFCVCLCVCCIVTYPSRGGSGAAKVRYRLDGW